MAVDERGRLPAFLEHKSEGRIRLRVPKSRRNPEALERVQRHLESMPGVERASVNPLSGSILVEGQRTDALHAALHEVIDIVARNEGRENEVPIEVAVDLVKLVDAKLSEVSDGRVSLRWLVPGAFVAVGIRQLLREGFTLGTVPWYVLLYYGVDSFLKLYPEHAPKNRPQLQVITPSDG